MINLIPEGPDTLKTTVLHDIIRIQAERTIIVIDTSNENTSKNPHHTNSRPDRNE